MNGMSLEGYRITDDDSWQWLPVTGPDIADMLAMSRDQYEDDSAGQFKIDMHKSAQVLTVGVVNQLYQPTSELLCVARDRESREVVAWFWAKRGCYQEFSSEESSELRIIHCRKDIANRTKIRLVAQAVLLFQQWGIQNEIPILVSATLRGEQSAFLRLLEASGFTVHGSYAFFRTDSYVAEVQAPVEEKPAIYTGTQR
jgi:hypothetical protein